MFYSFFEGKKLDLLVVNVAPENGPFDVFKDDTTENRFEKFIYLGDDRNIEKVYVDGRKVLG